MTTARRVLAEPRRPGLRLLLTLLLVLGLATAAAAQSPTGTISGRTLDAQGQPLLGVTITIASPSLQGQQRTVTSENGDYIFKLLPPGLYTMTFQLPGFAVDRRERQVSASEPVALDVVLKVADVTESVTVTTSTMSFVTSVESATNIKQSLLNDLPTTRDPLAAAALAPATHQTGPSGALSLSGGMSFDNLMLVNGVTTQDNIRGTPLTLFIEDAIQETTIQSTGVSAEFGRFSGGIINVLTKSGGNRASGTFRTTFTNDAWRTVTPIGENKVDKIVPMYESTFGGPAVRDRLWFFAAVRSIKNEVARETGFTKQAYTRTTDERRLEVKATQSLGMGRRLAVNYVSIDSQTMNSAYPSSAEIMDLASLTNPKTPERLAGVHFTGAFGSRVFLEAQYSQRHLTFEAAGGLTKDLIAGTPLRDQQTGAWWWAPNFCGVCGNEERNNNSLVVKASYFLSTGAGSHNVVFGYDGFNDRMLNDNQQSGSDYHVWATRSVVRDGTIYPVISPGFSTFIIYWPVRQNAQHTNFRTHSVFANDAWAVNRHVSVNLGVRYDRNDGRDSAGGRVANDARLSPRVGLAWDPSGAGQMSISASASRYVSALNNAVAGSASPAGNPAIFGYFYGGPAINTGSASPLVTSDVALRRVFDWYFAAPRSPFFVNIPGLVTKINGSLKSPYADEFAVGISRHIGDRGAIRADIVDRRYKDFYSSRTDRTTGTAADEFGQRFDVGLIENSNDLTRRYRALNLQGGYNGTNVTVGGSYTLSSLRGNFDGENVRTGPLTGEVAIYPEYQQPEWYAPEGNLAADQRHRGRLWATYRLPWGRRVVQTTVSAVQTLQSGTPYGAVGTVAVSPYVQPVGYELPPDTNRYYFTGRDAFRTADSAWTNFALNLERRLGGASAPALFAQFQVLNVFNQFQAYRNANGEIDATVTTANDDSTLADFNPFTTTPVEGVHWKKGDRFGQAVARGAYTTPRTVLASMGIRF